MAAAPDAAARVLFGGPDLQPRLLRDELQRRVEAVPRGGEIAWSTYYFRDRELAKALMAASDRGVGVTLRLEGAPRFPHVNETVIAILEAHGLGGGLKVNRSRPRLVGGRRPYWHSKIYCFSDPAPAALIGSFNPSGDDPEDTRILAEIGDQDRGHNLLVELNGDQAFRMLCNRVRRMGSWGARFAPRQNRPIRLGATTVWTYPRLLPGIIDRQLRQLGEGDRVYGAISHLKRGPLANRLSAASRRGASIELLLHDTERRVPEAMVAALVQAGIVARRYVHAGELPLHLKFLIVESRGVRQAWFGSFNFNRRSYWDNFEVLARSFDLAVVEAFDSRFDQVRQEVAQQGD